MRSMLRSLALCAAAVVSSAVPARADVVFHTGADPYLSFANSPWAAEVSEWDYFFFEDFEDFAFDVPGVTASDGWIIGPTALTDSVDADDGVIDGSGVAGHSYFTGVGSEIRFDFNAEELGQLPTRSGLVWTDGMAGVLVTLEAFGPDEEFLGSVDVVLGDMFFSGTTDEDRFLGVEAGGGGGARASLAGEGADGWPDETTIRESRGRIL